MMGERLIREANNVFGCNLLLVSRKRNNVDGRVAVSYYLRIYYKMTFQKIGALFGKEHGIIMHYVRLHKTLYKYNMEYRTKYNQMTMTHNYSRLLCNPCFYQFNKISA